MKDLRALMMFDTLPAGCKAMLVTDDYCAPHIRAGEFVVLDTADTTPRNGEVYVIQWIGGRTNVCQARVSEMASNGCGETMWAVGAIKQPGFRGWCDGWWKTDQLKEKLMGAVIGIYQPAFVEPLRGVSEPHL